MVHIRLNEPRFSPTDLCFRSSEATLIPYVELPLFTKDHYSNIGPVSAKSNFALKKIIYGPGLNAQVTERSIQYLTAKARFPHEIRVEPSKIKVKV